MSRGLHAKGKPTTRSSSLARPNGRPTAPGRSRTTPSSTRAAGPTKRRPSTHRSTKGTAGRTVAAGRVATSTRRPSTPASSGRRAPARAATGVRSAGATRTGSQVRTPKERAAIEARRNRVPLVLAAVAAVVILATSFPLTVLLDQHRQLSAAAAQLSQLKHQNGLLSEQDQQLGSNAEVTRLAQQDYQLVEPGQALYDILPGAGQTPAPGSPTTGDPADQPLVSPAQAPNMSPDPGLPTSAAGTGSSGTTTSSPSSSTTGEQPTSHAGFWSRVGSTLEFWK